MSTMPHAIELTSATSRRTFLATSSLAALSAWTGRPFVERLASAAEPTDDARLPVAAIVTVYQKSSHADVIVGKILEGFRQDGGRGPALRLMSLYVDQVPAQDMSRGLAEKHGFRLTKTIDEALTLGTNQLQVAGVLSIGEHGDYPFTPDTKQHMYPRRRFFEQIVGTFERCGRTAPVFNDKHLAYRWEDARWMYEASRRLGFPLLAGSSVPVAWREPAVELPRDTPLEGAVTIGYSGFEVYGFHALEAHQSVIERRRGGESGVTDIQVVQGDAIRQAAADGRWSRTLLAAALKTIPKAPADDGRWELSPNSAVYLLNHRDGLKSAVVMTNDLGNQFATAVQPAGGATPWAVWQKLEDGPPHGHFAYLVRAIDATFHQKKEVYPVERTLLTTGILDRVMQSLATNGKRVETPELAIRYQPTDWPFANHPEAKFES